MPELLRLPGVRSDTLLGYLKGLGILQILGRQEDPGIGACWRDGALALRTDRSLKEIETFFAERWVPAPVVSPWNGGSGFHPKDNTEAFEFIERTDDPRLAPTRAAITIARAALRSLGLTEKPEPKQQKRALLRVLRATLPDAALEWLDAAVVLSGDEIEFPPALGSGGNDGRYDIANNYAQAVCLMLGAGGPAEPNGLTAALLGHEVPLRKMSLAHLTRDASPVNAPVGEADALANPWDLVLAVHGLLLFAAGATRRLGAGTGYSAPFTLRETGAGYGSAVSGEKGRAELWMPVWERAATLAEVQALLREGRVQVGRRGATSGLDAARATGAFGVARGVRAFERFAVLERAGQSNLSVPTGRIDVRPNPAARALATLDPWLDRVLRHGAGDVPQTQRLAIDRLRQAAFVLAQHGTGAAAVDVLVALGEVEAIVSTAAKERRPDGLRPATPDAAPWAALLDGTVLEHRLAVGWASLADQQSAPDNVSVRGALVGSRTSYGDAHGWQPPRGATIARRLALTHERRWLTTDAADARFAYGQPVALVDLAAFVRGAVDDRGLAALLGGLAVLAWRADTPRLDPPENSTCPDPLLTLLALAFWDPRSSSASDQPPHDAFVSCLPRRGWVSQLVGGNVAAVRNAAHLRLTVAHARPLAEPGDLQVAALDGVRLAAALLARPSRRDLHHLLTTTTIQEKTHS